jgi:hypothetical protein
MDINNFKKTTFDFEEMPQAFLAENKMSKKLRDKLLVRNLNHENDIGENFLSQHFFSPENMEIINKMLVLEIFKQSNKTIKIAYQSQHDLMVTMTWVYTHYAKNLPFKIKEQIRQLNQEVVRQLTPQLMSQAQQHIDYLKEISQPRVPLPPPISTLRDTTLPAISDIFHDFK